MTMPEMVRKLRSLWRATLRMISIGLFRLRASRLKAGKGLSASRLRLQLGQPRGIHPPPLLMDGALLLVGQVAVPEPEQRVGSVGCEGDLDGRRAWRHFGVSLPSPAEDNSARRLDELVLADCKLVAGYVEPEGFSR